jgi:hypothetical protein
VKIFYEGTLQSDMDSNQNEMILVGLGAMAAGAILYSMTSAPKYYSFDTACSAKRSEVSAKRVAVTDALDEGFTVGDEESFNNQFAKGTKAMNKPAQRISLMEPPVPNNSGTMGTPGIQHLMVNAYCSPPPAPPVNPEGPCSAFNISPALEQQIMNQQAMQQ